MKAVPDSGAEGFFIGLEAMENIGLDVGDFSTATTKIVLADGSRAKPVGEIQARIRLGDKHYEDKVILMGDSDGMLIPWYAMKEFGLLNPEYPDPPRTKKAQAAVATKDDGDGEPADRHAWLQVGFSRGHTTSPANATTTDAINGNGAKAAEPPAAKKVAGRPPAATKTSANATAKPKASTNSAMKMKTSTSALLRRLASNANAKPNGDEKREMADDPNVKKRVAELVAEFSDIFDDGKTLKPMRCDPIKIELREDAVPFAMCYPRSIPHAVLPKVEAAINDMIERGIIEKVTKPTEWCAPIVTPPKPNGGVRVCQDFRKLNEFVKRPWYPMKTPQTAIDRVKPNARWFTTIDAKQGYWMLPLDEGSRDLTTFICFKGRYRFLRAPMGLVNVQDEFDRIIDEAMEGVEDTSVMREDIMVASENLDDHLKYVREVFQRCRDNGITVNKEKLSIAKNEAHFVGFEFSEDGIQYNPTKIDAIQDFPPPTNITELRSFLGMCNQLGGFVHDLSMATNPLRSLLRSRTAFVWNDDHQAAFEISKATLLSPPVLAIFDMTKPTRLLTDASRKHGLGFIMQQQHGDNWRLVQAGSRYINETEAGYSMIELELLAVVWAMQKLRLYLLGIPFKLIVDHQPLVSVLGKQTLDMIDTPRLQRLKEKTAPFIFTVEWQKGSSHLAADALSRRPTREPTPEDAIAAENEVLDTRMYLQAAAATITTEEETEMPDLQLQRIRDATAMDDELRKVIAAIRNDSQDGHDFPQSYRAIREDLSVLDGIVVYRSRIVVPAAMRKDILRALHGAHSGIVRSKQRARQCVFWPKIGADIEDEVRGCDECQREQASQTREPMYDDDFEATFPFQEISMDLFEYGGRFYLATVDRYSGWPCITRFSRCPTTAEVITASNEIFSTHGVPVRVRSDGGPQFKSREWLDFLTRKGTIRRLSSPHMPSGNGHAEAGVKAMKRLVAKTGGDIRSEAFLDGLREWRNTPKDHGQSPAEIVFGRSIRSTLPSLTQLVRTPVTPEKAVREEKNAILKEKVRDRFNAKAKPLDRLPIGANVWIQDPHSKKWTQSGKVIAIGERRSYDVRLGDGRIWTRNRKFLRPRAIRFEDELGDQGSSTTRRERDGANDKKTPAAPATRRSRRAKRKPDRFVP